ncbi:intradiol ring-cleavage dioxygenase [Streptomyces sp. NPDC012888]|uniref:dioxygenase family protein n=1 Tax=Streptomyces sp. NPDC012888 TaxID=3364855 RepID=UPI0036B5A6FF
MSGSDRDPAGRRVLLLAAGAAGIAALTSGCGSTTRHAHGTSAYRVSPAGLVSHTTPAPPVCVLSPETGEGPYYVPDASLRSDITEDREGVPLRLDLTVVRATRNCAPLAGVAVDAWQADALGEYSSGGATYLRGTQLTDDAGRVTFRTIVPGWYAHVAPHVHVKVHPDADTEVSTQLFLPEELLLRVFSRAPYSARQAPAHPNLRDDRFESKGPHLTLDPIPDGTGYKASFTIGIA